MKDSCVTEVSNLGSKTVTFYTDGGNGHGFHSHERERGVREGVAGR